MDFKELAKARYSCRQFTDKKVDHALVEQLLEAANLAPTALNMQPIQIFCMESEEAQETIHKATSCTYGASTFLVVGYRQEDGWVRSFDKRPFADVDASIAATHIMLQAADLGLATTWVGFFDAPLLKKHYPAMADYELIAMFPVGYPAEQEGAPSPRHFERKSMDEVVTVL